MLHKTVSLFRLELGSHAEMGWGPKLLEKPRSGQGICFACSDFSSRQWLTRESPKVEGIAISTEMVGRGGDILSALHAIILVDSQKS